MTPATNPDVEVRVGATDSSDNRSLVRAWYALVVLVITMLLAFIDRQILVLLAQQIKVDLSLSDLQIGETQGLFPAVFTVIAMFPLAWLADRFERSWVMCGCVLVWSVATAASGLAFDFTSLLACTIAIVIGEAALSPIVYSLVADLFPEKHRPRANIVCYGASALGAGLGLTLGGALLGLAGKLQPMLPAAFQDLEPWRLTFFLVALPGPLVAFLVFTIGRTRREVVVSKGAPPPAKMGPYLKQHGAVALGAFGTMAFFSFALLAVSTWLPIALIRVFKADSATVGVNFGMSFMGGAIVGLVLANFLAPLWKRLAGKSFVLRAISVAAAVTAIPTLMLPFVTELWQAYVLFACFSAIFITGVALMPGMMQDVAPAALRARVIAGGTALYMVVGHVSPPLVGFFSDQAAGDPRGLLWAITGVGVAGFIACSALARFMEGPYRRTVAAIGET